MKLALAVLVSMFLASCAPQKSGREKASVAEPTMESSKHSASVTRRDLRPLRPPELMLELELSLANGSDEPRWFVLPYSINSPNPPGGVHTLETYELAGGSGAFGVFIGNGGFQALLLPGGGELRLRELGVRLYAEDTPTGPIEVPVQVVRTITLDGELAAAWFKHDPTLASKVDGAVGKRGPIKSTEGLKEAAVVMDVEETIELSVEL